MPETRILPPSTHLAPGCNTNSSKIVDQPLPGIKFNFASLFLIQISSHLLPGTYIKESFALEYNSNQEISPIVKFSDKKEDKAKILKLRREAPPMPIIPSSKKSESRMCYGYEMDWADPALFWGLKYCDRGLLSTPPRGPPVAWMGQYSIWIFGYRYKYRYKNRYKYRYKYSGKQIHKYTGCLKKTCFSAQMPCLAIEQLQ